MDPGSLGSRDFSQENQNATYKEGKHMILGSLILGLVGVLCTVIGWLIWKKQKMALLHDYHYKYVSEGDKKPFCGAVGKGIVAIGAGLLVTALLLPLTQSVWCFLGIVCGFVVGFSMLFYADRKYNQRKDRSADC